MTQHQATVQLTQLQANRAWHSAAVLSGDANGQLLRNGNVQRTMRIQQNCQDIQETILSDV